jgi:transcriptional regulator with XRE-family HTH domain
MSADSPPIRKSPFIRPGMPGYELRCLREAMGLSRIEAAQLCNMSVPTLKAIESFDDGNAYLWAAMRARYELLESYGTIPYTPCRS